MKKLLLGILLPPAALLFAADTNGPAPATDRVGFPQGYATTFEVLRTVTREEGRKLVTVYGNQAAAGVTNKSLLPYPYGSVLVMETARAATNSSGAVVKGDVLGLHVMRKEKNFGAAYAAKRSGEWEYVEYRADGSYLTPPQKSAACSECHLKADPGRDFVYKGRLSSAEQK